MKQFLGDRELQESLCVDSGGGGQGLAVGSGCHWAEASGLCPQGAGTLLKGIVVPRGSTRFAF